MKKALLSFVALVLIANASSQDSVKKDTAWKFGGMFTLTISQSSFTNWAAGGENSYSGSGRVGLFANYVQGKSALENNLDMAYGRSKQGDLGLRKSDDMIEFNSKYGYKASKKWFYTAVLNAKTQFKEGYDYKDNDSVTISQAFAPLYLNFALGMDYKPNKHTSVFISPANVKYIYVSDTKYALRYSIDSAQNSRTDFGAIVKFKFEKELVKNLNFLTKLDLFANYLELNTIKDVDVNWEILVTINVFKVLSLNLNTNLIWDNDIKYIEENGESGNARAQFKEIFGAGLAYEF